MRCQARLNISNGSAPVPLERIVIVGNDDIAWIAAELLARAVQPPFVDLCLIRPTEPVSAWSTAARGATLTPSAAAISDSFGVSEWDLLRSTQGNFLLGTIARGFGPEPASFLPFGALGEPHGQTAFHHLLARARRSEPTIPLSAFVGGSICAQTARFEPASSSDAFGQAVFNYGLHLRSDHYAAAAAAEAEARGVRITNASVVLVERDDRGHISSLTTDCGDTITADLFIDCGNWLDDEPDVVDWSRWLPSNRLATVARPDESVPTTAMQLAAHGGGWQRQSRFGFRRMADRLGRVPLGAMRDAVAGQLRGDWRWRGHSRSHQRHASLARAVRDRSACRPAAGRPRPPVGGAGI